MIFRFTITIVSFCKRHMRSFVKTWRMDNFSSVNIAWFYTFTLTFYLLILILLYVAKEEDVGRRMGINNKNTIIIGQSYFFLVEENAIINIVSDNYRNYSNIESFKWLYGCRFTGINVNKDWWDATMPTSHSSVYFIL